MRECVGAAAVCERGSVYSPPASVCEKGRESVPCESNRSCGRNGSNYELLKLTAAMVGPHCL